MIQHEFIKMMYEQWRQGNPDFHIRWADFVELASRECKAEIETVREFLQNQRWFHYV